MTIGEVLLLSILLTLLREQAQDSQWYQRWKRSRRARRR